MRHRVGSAEVVDGLSRRTTGVRSEHHVEIRIEHRRHEMQDGDAGARDEVAEVRGIAVSAGHRDHHPRPDAQRPQQLPDRHVEGRRRLVQHAVPRGDRVTVLHPPEALLDRPMTDLDTFGGPGRSRREDDVGGQISRNSGLPMRPCRRTSTRGVETGDEVCVDDQGGFDRGDDRLPPLFRFGRIDRHVGRTQPDRGIHGAHLLDRAVQCHDDAIAAPRAQTREPVRECVAGTREVAVGEGGVAERHRGRVRRRLDLAIEGGQHVLTDHADGRPAGTEVFQGCRLPGHQQVEVGDRPVRVRDELGEHVEQATAMCLEFRRPVQRGVRVQTHFQRGLRAGREDVHHQVFDQTGGQHVIAHAGAVDDDRLVEQQQVDQRSERRAAGITETGCRPDVLGSIPLMAQTRGDLRADRRDDVGARRGGDSVHAQGQHVGDHPGRVPDARRRPCGDRQTEDDVVAAGHAREERGERGGEDGSNRGVEIPGAPTQRLIQFGTEQPGGDDGLVADAGSGRVCREADPLGEPGGTFLPELAVFLEPRALPVGGVVGDHLGDAGAADRSASGSRRDRGSDLRRRIRRAVLVVARHRFVQAHQCAVSVERDVVTAHVPVRPVVGDPDEGRDGDRIGQQVHGPLMVGAHPVGGGRFGIRVRPQIDVDHVERYGEVDVLPRRAVDLDHTRVRRLQVACRLPNSTTEQLPIERASVVDDVEVVRDGDRVVVDQVLGKPHGALGRGQIQ